MREAEGATTSTRDTEFEMSRAVSDAPPIESFTSAIEKELADCPEHRVIATQPAERLGARVKTADVTQTS